LISAIIAMTVLIAHIARDVLTGVLNVKIAESVRHVLIAAMTSVHRAIGAMSAQTAQTASACVILVQTAQIALGVHSV
jgi:hypothetical protein